jgi:hypothetical protein
MVGAARLAAIDYPASATLAALSPELTLPENVEHLKRAGVSRAEVDLVLAHALQWWDDVGVELSWLPPAEAARVRRCEADLLRERRTLWCAQLLGTISAQDAEVKRREALASARRAIAGLLTPEQAAEYEVRASPAAAKVREWAWGLDIPEEKLWWLIDAERERHLLQSRTFAAGERRVSLASDSEAGELVRIRAALLALERRRRRPTWRAPTLRFSRGNGICARTSASRPRCRSASTRGGATFATRRRSCARIARSLSRRSVARSSNSAKSCARRWWRCSAPSNSPATLLTNWAAGSATKSGNLSAPPAA